MRALELLEKKDAPITIFYPSPNFFSKNWANENSNLQPIILKALVEMDKLQESCKSKYHKLESMQKNPGLA
jgi:hypothetical protein